jgi:transcriptional regulator with XRE-family HTH domain
MNVFGKLPPSETLAGILTPEERSIVETRAEIAFYITEARTSQNKTCEEFAEAYDISLERLLQYENVEDNSMDELAVLFGKLGISFGVRNDFVYSKNSRSFANCLPSNIQINQAEWQVPKKGQAVAAA